VLTYSYARSEITLTIAAGVLATAIVGYYFGWWALLPALLALALLSFYRNPPRAPAARGNVILAAADGKIVSIDRNVAGANDAPELRIMTFLAVYNVHVNRAPCAGRVVKVDYRPGKYLNALNPAADVENESNEITLEPVAPLPGPVRVRQIAGVLARRIVCRTRVGDELGLAERYGMIKLGSRTEVTLPEDPGWVVQVRLGDKVKAGQTVLATLRQENLSATTAAAPDVLRESADPPEQRPV